jgi:ribosomal protein L16 Arg81 hydroxylase
MVIPFPNSTKDTPTALTEFEDLIYPVPIKDFWEGYWGRANLVVHRQERNYYGSLFSLSDVDRCLNLAANSSATVLQIVPPPNSQRESKLLATEAISKDRLYNAYLSGDTIRLIGAEKFWPPLALMLASLQETFNSRCGMNIFLTPPQSQAFSLHFDTVDVIVLQVEGSKRWRVWNPTYEFPMDFPLCEVHTQQVMEKDEGKLTLVQDFMLEAGDFFYMPRGYYHQAVSADELSLHLTITVHPLYWLDLLKRALELAAIEEPSLRQALPAGFVLDPQAQQAMALTFGEMLGTFSKKVSFEKSLCSLVEEYVDSRRFPADGHFAALATLPEVSENSMVERRRGLACRVEVLGEKVMIRFGPNSVQGPGIIQSAFEFIRDQRRFRVADLPGELSAKSKEVLVRRLIREGLLTPVAV